MNFYVKNGKEVFCEVKYLFYYRGLYEFEQTTGFLVGTMQSAQDVYESWIKYFNEELLDGLKID